MGNVRVGGNSNNNEAAVQAAQAARAHFFDNPQSDHAQIVSCNISFVLSRLSKKYLILGAQNSEAMKAARQSRYISAFKTYIADRDWFPNNAEVASAINYIETVMNEPSNWQDKITFWEKGDELGTPKQVSLTMSVRETLVIVCAALMDDKVYRHESGAEQEKARVARIEILCDCLIDLAKNNATHESVRHQLAFCLNYNYPDIKFITTDFDFIWPHIRPAIVKKLLLENRWQIHFKLIVWPWIKEGEMPQAAWDLLNSTVPTTSVASSSSSSALFIDELKASFADMFLSRGLFLADKSTDSTKAISKLMNGAISDCCSRIRDMDFPAIANLTVSKLHHFMRSLGEAEKKKKEIIVFIQWLESSFDPNDGKHIAKLNGFFMIYEINKKINRYSYMLKRSGDQHGLLSRLKPMIDNYFENNFEIPDVFQDEIDAFDNNYGKFIEGNKVAWVESFFELWLKNKNVEHNDGRAHLFYQLCHLEYKADIKISDEEIMDVCGASDLNAAVEVDAYFLNRCLLHALTVPVAEWSKTFSDTLRRLYQFILNNFNTAEMRSAAGQFKKASYPNSLLRQIKYLLECYELKSNKPAARPEQAVLTPTTIDTEEEVFQGLCYIAVAANQYNFSSVAEEVCTLKNKVSMFPVHRLVQILRKCTDDTVRLEFFVAFMDITSELSNTRLIDILDSFLSDKSRLQVLRVIKVNMHELTSDEVTAVLCVFADDRLRLQAFAALIDKIYMYRLSSVELRNIFLEFKSVVSQNDTSLMLENQIQIFTKLFLINEFPSPAVYKKRNLCRIHNIEQLSSQYIATTSTSALFATANRSYVEEVKKLDRVMKKQPDITFEEIAEFVARLLIQGKKQINFDDDLFVMLQGIKRSMQQSVVASEETSSFTAGQHRHLS
jgi:hypothetical protein